MEGYKVNILDINHAITEKSNNGAITNQNLFAIKLK